MSIPPFGDGASDGPPNDEQHAWQVRTPTARHAETVAGWSSSADEAQRWVSNAVHPFPASVVTTCGSDDVGSQRVAERCGFTRVGQLGSHLVFKGGRRDTVIFSLLPGGLS